MTVFSTNRYRQSISQLREALGVGVPQNRGTGVVEVENQGVNYFRFNIADLYMTHLSEDGANWTEIDRPNYAQMRIDDSFAISGFRIKNAFQLRQPHDGDLALVIIGTAEAVRSHVVYQVVQQMFSHPGKKMEWGELKPLLIGSWAFNAKENHKRKPLEYGPLGANDYYNPKAIKAIQAIRKTGYQVT